MYDFKDKIKKLSDKNEKVKWNYKRKKLEKKLLEIQKVENKILDIILKEKQPLIKELEEIRKEMVETCVHPDEYLVEKEENNTKVIICKFCNKRFVENVK